MKISGEGQVAPPHLLSLRVSWFSAWWIALAVHCVAVLLGFRLAASPELVVELENGEPLVSGQVVAWGWSPFGETIVPRGLTGIRAVAAGIHHSVALRRDGSVIAWGGNAAGQASVPVGLSGVISIAAGWGQSLALKDDGTLVAWGSNAYGEREPPPGLGGVVAIAAGWYYSMALLGNGTVVAWGGNASGETNIPADLTGVRAIDAGPHYAAALKSDGTPVLWGSNISARNRLPADFTNVVIMAAGGQHFVAKRQDGRILAWGEDYLGHLEAPAGLTDVEALTAGALHTVALHSDGTVSVWGFIAGGELNYPSTLRDVQSVAAGYHHNLAIRTSRVSFAEQRAGTTGAAKHFVVRNSGDSVLEILGVSISAGAASDFRIDTAALGTVIPGGGQARLSVAFAPKGQGVRTATLRLRNNDPEDGDFEVILTGTTIPGVPEIAVFSSTNAISGGELTDGVGTNEFFPAALAGPGETRWFTIKNTGSASLTNLSLTVAGPNPEDFTVGQQGVTHLAPGDTTTFSVTFGPTRRGVRNATIYLASDDADENPFRIEVGGRGLAPEIHLEEADGRLLNEIVVGWGSNDFGQINAPPKLPRLSAIDAGQNHTVALTEGGRVLAWGHNSFGQTNVPADLVAVKAIAAGWDHNVALKLDGTVVAWGANHFGQTSVPTDLSQIQAIAANGHHCLALKHDGTVIAWGLNDQGQTNVPAGLNGVRAIAAGASHNLALKNDGTVVTWGLNFFGLLNVPEGLNDVTAIAAGTHHSIALSRERGVVAWGRPFEGQTTTPNGLSRNSSIAAGGYQSLAIDEEGWLVAWGANASLVPNRLRSLPSTIAVAAGEWHAVALTSSSIDFGNQTEGVPSHPRSIIIRNNGEIPLDISRVSVVEGDAADFQVDTSEMLPTLPPGLGNTICRVTFTPSVKGFRTTTLRILSNDALTGPVDIRLAGRGTSASEIAVFAGIEPYPANEQISGVGTNSFTDLIVGEHGISQSFTVTNTGTADLSDLAITFEGADSGDFVLGALGSTNLAPQMSATFTVSFVPKSSGTRAAVISIASDDPDENPFRIHVAGTGLAPEISVEQPAGTSLKAKYIATWGSDGSGELNTPPRLSGFQAVSAGLFFSALLKTDGTVVAWGQDFAGTVHVPSGLTDAKAIATGRTFCLALRHDGRVVAWGSNSYGQTDVPEGLTDVRSIAAGGFHSVALKGDGTVVCWGLNGAGQTTVPTALRDVVAIAANSWYTMALRRDGTVVSWGGFENGPATAPEGLEGVVSIAAGVSHSVALKRDGTLVAWENNPWTSIRSNESTIPDGVAGVVRIFAGRGVTMAVKRDGTRVAWGSGDLMPTLENLPDAQAVSANGYHALALVGSTISFGNQTERTTSESKTFTIKNSGRATLTVVRVSILGENSADFSVVTNGLPEIVPINSGGAPFSVAFTPRGRGSRTATLRVESNDLDESFFDIQLIGWGASASEIEVYGGTDTMIGVEQTDNLGTNVFASTMVGTRSQPQTFTIKSTGRDPLTELSIKIRGANPGDFQVTPLTTTTMAPTETTTFTVTFTPTVKGERSAVISVLSDDDNESSFELKVGGLALAPEIAVEQPVGFPLLTESIQAWGKNDRGQTTVPVGMRGAVAIAAGLNHMLLVARDGKVVAWGANESGQSAIPDGLSDVRAVAAGFEHSMALTRGGSVVAWGTNQYGQLDVPAGLSNVLAITAGAYHSVALKGDGTVVAWGVNNAGQLAIPAGLNSVQAIAAGWNHTVALRRDGTLVAWGYNIDGQILVPFGLTGIQAIAAGSGHTVAVKSDGSVVAWGSNTYGESTVPAGLTGVRFVAAGEHWTLALKRDGTVVSWGRNDFGGTMIPPGLSEVMAITAGGSGSGLVLQASTVDFGSQAVAMSSAAKPFTIRNTGDGPLRIAGVSVIDGDVSDFAIATNALLRELPASNGATTFSVAFTPGVSGGRRAILRIHSDDADEGFFDVRITGIGVLAPEVAVFDSNARELEDNLGTQVISNAIVGIDSIKWSYSVKNIGSLDLVGLALKVAGPNAGDFILGALGTNRLAPGASTSFMVSFVPRARGLRRSLVNLTSNDADESPFELNFSGTGIAPEIELQYPIGTSSTSLGVVAWGWNYFGQTNVPPDLYGVEALAAGEGHTVALRYDGTVVAWGDNVSGQSRVPAGLTNVQAVAAGASHTVALTEDGKVVAWGRNDLGQINVPAGLAGVRAIAAGGSHTLVVRRDGTVGAWGNPSRGQLNVPVGLAGVTAVAAGYAHSLALRTNGMVVAWGNNDFGQLGVPLELTNVRAIAAGIYHNVALKHDGTVVAWGWNGKGQTNVPNGLSEVIAVAAGELHTVALRGDGTLVAWGSGNFGQSSVNPGLGSIRAVAAGANHTAVLSSSAVSLGEPIIGTGGVTRRVGVYNRGELALDLSGVVVRGDEAEDFSVNTAGMLLSLPPGGETTFAVTFAPSVVGTRAATLRVVSNDSRQGVFELQIEGTGVAEPAAEIEVFVNGVTIVDGDLVPGVDDHTDFGSVPVTSGAVARGFTIRNGGRVDLTLGEVTVRGTNATDFRVAGPLLSTLAPSNSTSFEVIFDPIAVGLRSAVLSIVNSDSDSNPFEFQVQGTGIGGAPKVLDVRSGEGGRIGLQFGADPGARCQVQYATGIESPLVWKDFVPAASGLVPAIGVFNYTDESPGEAKRFYRVILLP